MVKFRPVNPHNVPDAIKAGATEELVFVAHATGVQIYVCRSDAEGKPAWVLKAPEAQLFDEQGNVVGSHFAGPTWQHNDGSEISGRMAAKTDAPTTDAIPWLLISVTGHSGKGVFSRITTIQRVHTTGGLPPAAAGCNEQQREVEFRSAYAADYYFYERRA